MLDFVFCWYILHTSHYNLHYFAQYALHPIECQIYKLNFRTFAEIALSIYDSTKSFDGHHPACQMKNHMK